MVRMMGTFDNWINQRDSEFISIVKCIDELASKNDSTIKATISYLFENLLTAKLYIDSGLHLTLVNNTGLLGLETPNEILTAIFSDISPTFVNVCKSLPHGVSNKYAKYYIKKAELLINEIHTEPPLTDNNRLAQQLQATIARLTAENNELKKQIEQQAVKPNQRESVADNDLLKAIFDDSKPNQYAPELHKAILIWQEIYMTDNISKYIDTHNGRYTEALKKLKINFTDNAPKERIRIITTPKKKKEQTKK